MSDRKKLRLITYLSPGIPVQVFEAVQGYLEEVTGLESYLIYESRWTGPPADRTNPFSADEVDIGFMRSTDFLGLVQRQDSCVELCGAGAVHVHQKNTDRPVSFSDLIIKSTNNTKFKELHDLRGHSFAYSSNTSVHSCMAVLEHLKKNGFDATFFGDKFESGSHLASIQAVLDSRVETAAVDSSVLAGFLTQHPYYKEELQVILSLGPLPTHPIVFNSKLPDELKQQLTTALLNMNTVGKWNSVLQSYGIAGFAPLDSSVLDIETEMRTSLKGKTMNTTYY